MAQRKFIIDGGFQTSDDSSIAANLEMTGHILPTVDSDGTTGYDLGSTTKKWRDLFLSQGSLFIDGQKVLQSDSGTIVVSADPNQGLTTRTTGSGVLAFDSAQPISMLSTLQMGSGKKITDADGTAVVFGDKVDVDNNQIINVGAPTADTNAATKKYVDDEIDGLVNGAPGALDTLNELANALGDDSNFASTMTTSLATKAATTYVDSADSSVASAASTDATTKADAAQAAAATDATTKANAAEANAISHTNTREVAITSGYESYADTAEADAITTAAADATTKADAAQAAAISAAASDATTKADAAEADAISTAAADATSKANAALTSAQSYADSATSSGAVSAAATDATTKADAAQAAAEATASADATSKANAAQAAAISTAASDATTKANAAQSAAESHADAAVSALVNGANSSFDTLKEIQDAMATDAELSAAISGLTIGNGTMTVSAGNGMTGGGSFTANQTGNSSITVAMSGSFTGGFTATGDITAYSDESLKTNIQTIDNALNRVESVRGVTFDRLEDGSTSTGVVAQELLEVLPEAVHTDAEGVHSVAYGNITGLLIEAVKELSAEVKELKK